MLTKITTTIALFEAFQTMRGGAAMKGSEGREQRTKDELKGRRRHYWNALRNPKTLFYSQTQKKLVLFPNQRNKEREGGEIRVDVKIEAWIGDINGDEFDI